MAKFRLPWLAAAAPAASAALPTIGTPAQDAVTAMNRIVYSHQTLAGLVEDASIRCSKEAPCPSHS